MGLRIDNSIPISNSLLAVHVDASAASVIIKVSSYFEKAIKQNTRTIINRAHISMVNSAHIGPYE